MKNMKGWMGKSHAIMSIALFLVCMIIPIDFFKETIGIMKKDVIFFIAGCIVVAGGALLPDLDNGQSSAGATLGIFGSICTTFMQSISHLFWTFLHGKGDKSPPTQHRYFWHTLIAGGGIFCLFYFGMPQNTTTIIENIKNADNISNWFQTNAVVLFFIILIFMSILCGSNMLLNRVIKAFKLPKLINYILPILILFYMFFIDFSHLRILGMCIGMGYIFHCIEDCFADSGVPIFWPLPIKNQLWKRIRFLPVTIQTGSLANTIIDAIMVIIAIILGFLIFRFNL